LWLLRLSMLSGILEEVVKPGQTTVVEVVAKERANR
jgi:hypothetical protein